MHPQLAPCLKCCSCKQQARQALIYLPHTPSHPPVPLTTPQVVSNLKTRFCKEQAWQAEMQGNVTRQRRWEAYEKLGTFGIYTITFFLSIQVGRGCLVAVGEGGLALVASGWLALAAEVRRGGRRHHRRAAPLPQPLTSQPTLTAPLPPPDPHPPL